MGAVAPSESVAPMSSRLQRVRNVATPNSRAARRATAEAFILLPLLVAIPYFNAHLPLVLDAWKDQARLVTAGVMVLAGWAFARDVGRMTRPVLFRTLAAEASGPADFLLRVITLCIVVIIAIHIAGITIPPLGTTGALGFVILGLAAQQSLGNIFAGFVLLGVHPYHIGDTVRLQGGGLGTPVEGRVAAMGLFYTRLTWGQDQIHVPNAAVLNSAVTPLREPDGVDLRATLAPGVTPTEVQEALAHISTPTRAVPRVDVEEVDQEHVVVRITATPEKSADGVHLADEVVSVITEIGN